jgi:hypothetical protein
MATKGLIWVLCGVLAALPALAEKPAEELRGTFRFAAGAVQFDVSPPLRDIPVRPPPDEFGDFFGTLMVDPDPDRKSVGPQTPDQAVQGFLGPLLIPAPIMNFTGGSGTANPPDPVGDVGPNHYVRMANASFQIFNKATGASIFGPANINTLFTGFGGACETENAGDPIVLHDQLADRWLLTQFSDSSGPGFFNCVALSTGSDPTGTYFRWAFPTGTFPDYPKYGVWPNAYLISTREVNANSIGVYAIDRQQMLAGNPSPVVISFVNPLSTEGAPFLGDGLLPADLDGSLPPPTDNPAYFIGTQDDGGPYGATQDSIFIWEFDIDFGTPANSTFILTDVLPIAPYDTIFPCVGRSCIPQPAPLGAVDVLSYRQRPMHRAAYRNFGSYESIVANQSVEAAEALAGIRWWEIRNPGNNPVLHQDSTYAPGVTDNIHRWMGSIAQDSAGNLGLGYSAGGETLFPSVRYTGRLESDPLSTMARGEGVFFDGGGGHTATTRRWGDYTSMNIDPVDDCTFWYVNEYFATSGTQWTLRVGSFKFPECEAPGGSFGFDVSPQRIDVCAPNDAEYQINAHAYNGFTGAATLAVSGAPAGTSVAFAPANIASIPGGSTLTVSNTGAAVAGSYQLDIDVTSGDTQTRSVQLDLFAGLPAAPLLASPANGEQLPGISPVLSWTAASEAQSYVVEVATDAGFGNIVASSGALTGTSFQTPTLDFGTQYFWRVTPTNICGSGLASATGNFFTRPAVGQCAQEDVIRLEFADDVESGSNGWVRDPTSGNAWALSTASPFSGSTSWLAQDATVTSDQRLISPPVSIPADHLLTTLRFAHEVNMEENGATACWDGGFVEISNNGGADWTRLETPSQLQDFYYGPLPGGESAYCGIEAYDTAALDIADYAGQTVQFRFRVLTDTNTGYAPEGWYVDDIEVVSCGLLGDGFE